MASKLIDNIETNDMNFKHLETTKDIVISPKNEFGDPQRPDSTHTWTAKVSDGTNYVGDYAVKVNATSLIVDSEDFTKLDVGRYELEVWEEWNDPDGTHQRSIYPSPSQTIPFTIYASIPDQAEKEIKRIGFQDVVDQAVMNIGMNYVFQVNTIEPDQTATVVQTASDGKNYVTFNIPRGKTGQQGFRGPAGKNFHIAQTFKSVKEMEASQGKGFEDGDFALIASDVNDPDNSKLYVWSDTNKQFTYMNDLSGATGIQGPAGPAPVLHVTKVTSLPATEQPTFVATPAGNGNYNVEIGIPKGEKGEAGSNGSTPVRGTDYWTDADKQAIQNEDKQYIDSKITDAYTKAKADVEDLTGGLMYYTTIDLSPSDYDQDLWYPVRSTLFSKQTLDRVSAIIPEGNPAVMKWGNWRNNSAIDTDTSANAMATVDMLTNHQGYGYNSYALAYVLINQFNLVKDGKNPICYDQNPNNGGYVFWLRGGSTYQLGITQPNSKWIVINKDTNINGFDVKPQPYPGNWKLAGSAVKAFSLEDVFSKLGGNPA